MPFLRNAWYAAVWDTDLKEPLARTILGQPILIVRGSDGRPVALRDACPHRFAPLSLGKFEGEHVTCPYHGLVFDFSGNCVDNPHGNGLRPSSLCVRTYPLEISDGMVWIWMGDPARAEATRPPSYTFMCDPGYAAVSGYLHVSANYELVTDNLLDLSHAEYLHPFIGPPGSSRGIRYRAAQEGERVIAYHDMPDQPNTPLFKLLLDGSVTRIDGRAHMHWLPPANMMLDSGVIPVGQPREAGAEVLYTHLLTPETETSTHYFWGAARDRALDDTQLSEMLRSGIAHAFEHEDEPMVRAVQSRMGDQDLFDLSPALLPMDEASVRARRTLRRLIEAEQSMAAD